MIASHAEMQGFMDSFRLRLPAALGCALILSSCATAFSNHPDATCAAVPGGYRIHLSGVRDNMTHSVIMYLARPSVEASFDLDVPRIVGTVPGAEVTTPLQPNRKFDGSMTFGEGTVQVALLFPGGTPPVPNDWNGTYKLGACRAP